jgi:hypothetical protein
MLSKRYGKISSQYCEKYENFRSFTKVIFVWFYGDMQSLGNQCPVISPGASLKITTSCRVLYIFQSFWFFLWCTGPRGGGGGGGGELCHRGATHWRVNGLNFPSGLWWCYSHHLKVSDKKDSWFDQKWSIHTCTCILPNLPAVFSRFFIFIFFFWYWSPRAFLC